MKIKNGCKGDQTMAKKIDEVQLLAWGFSKTKTPSLKLFLKLPIYPKTTTRPEMMKKMGCDGTTLIRILSRLPSNAPVIDEDKILSRLK